MRSLSWSDSETQTCAPWVCHFHLGGTDPDSHRSDLWCWGNQQEPGHSQKRVAAPPQFPSTMSLHFHSSSPRRLTAAISFAISDLQWPCAHSHHQQPYQEFPKHQGSEGKSQHVPSGQHSYLYGNDVASSHLLFGWFPWQHR
jgi:hypothetical protein